MRGEVRARVRLRAESAIIAFVLAGALLPSCAPVTTHSAPVAARSAPVAGASTGAAQLAPGVKVDRAQQLVTVDGTVVLTQGFLEQLVCTPSTRVHESLIAIDAAPRELHAALLLAGIEPGQPGRWQEVAGSAGNWTVDRVRPEGPPVDVRVRWTAPDGGTREARLLDWVRRVSTTGDPTAPAHSASSPTGQFVFSGSRIRANTPSMGAGEHYVADLTGSVVGLVTFGDEVIAYDEVIADKVDIDPATWVAWTERMPPEGTRVELLIRARSSGR